MPDPRGVAALAAQRGVAADTLPSMAISAAKASGTLALNVGE
jgi:hypothetical protein